VTEMVQRVQFDRAAGRATLEDDDGEIKVSSHEIVISGSSASSTRLPSTATAMRLKALSNEIAPNQEFI
jgi:hypothetical protein